MESILQNTGGVLVDAMRIMRNVCKKCILDKLDFVDLAHADREFSKLADDYKFVFDTNDLWAKLSRICKSSDRSVIMTTQDLPELLYKMIVIEYRDEVMWFDLHPAARRLYRENSTIIEAAVAASEKKNE